MISFAQNFEDVIIARIFRNQGRGIYVDVGAHFPIIDSVTEHFYRSGWRGVNIEPLPLAFAELVAARPRDINLNYAITAEDGSSDLFVLDGYSTLEKEIADSHLMAGRPSGVVPVKTTTLKSALDHAGVTHVDFLKIDVEGSEGSVLRSNDWEHVRPSLVLVEAVHPVTHAPLHHQWEDILKRARYDFVHFDGLNRFYWNQDMKSPQKDCFLPPNVLDDFTPYALVAALSHAAEAVRASQYDRQKLIETQAQAKQAIERAESLPVELHAELRNQLAEVDIALQELAKGRLVSPPHPLVADGWDAIVKMRDSQAAAIEKSATELRRLSDVLAACRSGLEDYRHLLRLSEQRRLALLEARDLAGERDGGTTRDA
ncbi:MAG TPA: FkbM family methyltransferase [Xanthobacteraceae bacterium]|nr:FkbM family methyltransferase [Xanthobacteraceae bacterium]